MASETEKATLRQKLETYEGCVEHMYLDTKGFVTVGVGHLLSTLANAQSLTFIVQKDSKAATDDQIKTDYDTIKKQTKGLLASTYKKHTKLKLK
jgi:GH24 family phage-related lysozyme (muramidase)